MKAEIIDGHLHVYPSNPTETWAMKQLIEYHGYNSLRSVVVLPEPRIVNKDEEEILDAVFGKIDSPVTKPPLPDIDDDDTGGLF